MQSRQFLSGSLLVLLICVGCGNPADNVPKADVKQAGNTIAQSSASTQPVTVYTFDPSTSTIEWIGSKVTGRHDGGFKQFSGEIHVRSGKPADSGSKVLIDTTSIWADNNRLTGHLKSPDFFDVAQFPTATFETLSITPQATNSLVTGNLTLHGVTKQISFPASIQITSDSLDLIANFVLNRFDFDIKYAGKADDLIRRDVVLKLKIKATKKA